MKAIDEIKSAKARLENNPTLDNLSFYESGLGMDSHVRWCPHRFGDCGLKKKIAREIYDAALFGMEQAIAIAKTASTPSELEKAVEIGLQLGKDGTDMRVLDNFELSYMRSNPVYPLQRKLKSLESTLHVTLVEIN